MDVKKIRRVRKHIVAKANKMGLYDLCKIALENGREMIIKKCPTCNRDLEGITDDNGVFIDRWCNKCGIHWSIFDLEIKEEKKKVNLGKWMV